MFSKILIASDLSSSSNGVVAAATALRTVGGASAVLVHFLEPPDCLYVRPLPDIDREARKGLEGQAKVLASAGFEVEIVTACGMPELEINRTAAKLGVKAIVVGSHGRNFLAELMLGGTVSAMLHQAALPVLLVRLSISRSTETTVEQRPQAQNLFDRVLFTTDFSDTAEFAFDGLREIARRTRCPVSLLHVQDRVKLENHLADRLAEFNRIDGERLRRMAETLREDTGREATIHLAYGLPLEEILRHIREDRATVTILGSRGRGFWGEALLGSVSHGVARHAESHVLMIPPAPPR